MVELPVRVRFHTAAPDKVREAALNAAVIPWGSPETTPIVDPEAAAGSATPPTGVAVTVTMAVPMDSMETFAGEIDNVTPGADCTCTVTVWFAVSPSPAAVTVTVADETGAEADADNVRVAGVELAPFAGVMGF